MNCLWCNKKAKLNIANNYCCDQNDHSFYKESQSKLWYIKIYHSNLKINAYQLIENDDKCIINFPHQITCDQGLLILKRYLKLGAFS